MNITLIMGTGIVFDPNFNTSIANDVQTQKFCQR